MSKSVKHLSIIKSNDRHDDYGTPLFSLKPLQSFKDACDRLNCTPKVDYFASEANHTCDKFYTKEDDAISRSWTENGFINPPYSIIKKVMKKAYEEHIIHNIELMILCYAKTETMWWHDFVEGKAEIHFIKGRMKFLCRHGYEKKGSAPYPSVWIIYRCKEEMKVRVQSMFPNCQKYGKLR